MTSSVTMIAEPCSRCGKTADLHAYRLSEVRYRGKVIPTPWLCIPCIKVEKRKAWTVDKPQA